MEELKTKIQALERDKLEQICNSQENAFFQAN